MICDEARPASFGNLSCLDGSVLRFGDYNDLYMPDVPPTVSHLQVGDSRDLRVLLEVVVLLCLEHTLWAQQGKGNGHG